MYKTNHHYPVNYVNPVKVKSLAKPISFLPERSVTIPAHKFSIAYEE